MTISKFFLNLLLALGSLYPGLIMAQDLSLFGRETYINQGDTMPYRILMPQGFDPAKKYPLIIVLHGSGERGNNNEAQLSHGADLFLKDSIRQKYPAIVVFPQCPERSYWSDVNIDTNADNKRVFHFLKNGEETTAMKDLIDLVTQLSGTSYVDKNRIYIGGLSMGGMGTFEILRRQPNVFAAAFTMCGGDNPLNAKTFAKKVPLWIFHGAKDDVVPPALSANMVAAIKAAGGHPKFTLYPNDNHNCWDHAFAEPELIPWLFSHKK